MTKYTVSLSLDAEHNTSLQRVAAWHGLSPGVYTRTVLYKAIRAAEEQIYEWEQKRAARASDKKPIIKIVK